MCLPVDDMVALIRHGREICMIRPTIGAAFPPGANHRTGCRDVPLKYERQSMLKAVRSRDRAFEGRRIMLVDDDIRNIFSLSSALEHKGMTVEIARNGFEAISQLNETPDIDLVLMDVMMPGMDGLEAMRRIRTDARFDSLPIIAITAKAMKDDQEQTRLAGMTDYLAKPIDLDRLYSLLRVWLPNLERVRG